MSRIAPRILALLVCAGCAPAASPIEGVWRSDRRATLAALEAHGGFNERQWEFFRNPELFGQMVQVYRGQRGFTIFDGECSPWVSLDIEVTGPGKITTRYLDEQTEEPQEVDLVVSGDRLLVPIQLLGGPHEVFSRVSAEDVARRHACFETRLAQLQALVASDE